eukprot:4933380-Amphidinium_carterae.1
MMPFSTPLLRNVGSWMHVLCVGKTVADAHMLQALRCAAELGIIGHCEDLHRKFWCLMCA